MDHQGKAGPFATVYEAGPGPPAVARPDVRIVPGSAFDARLGRAVCRVIDVSRHGARLQTCSEPHPGMAIRRSLPGIGDRPARAIRADAFTAGLEFLQPLSGKTFGAPAAG